MLAVHLEEGSLPGEETAQKEFVGLFLAGEIGLFAREEARPDACHEEGSVPSQSREATGLLEESETDTELCHPVPSREEEVTGLFEEIETWVCNDEEPVPSQHEEVTELLEEAETGVYKYEEPVLSRNGEATGLLEEAETGLCNEEQAGVCKLDVAGPSREKAAGLFEEKKTGLSQERASDGGNTGRPPGVLRCPLLGYRSHHCKA